MSSANRGSSSGRVALALTALVIAACTRDVSVDLVFTGTPTDVTAFEVVLFDAGTCATLGIDEVAEARSDASIRKRVLFARTEPRAIGAVHGTKACVVVLARDGNCVVRASAKQLIHFEVDGLVRLALTRPSGGPELNCGETRRCDLAGVGICEAGSALDAGVDATDEFDAAHHDAAPGDAGMDAPASSDAGCRGIRALEAGACDPVEQGLLHCAAERPEPDGGFGVTPQGASLELVASDCQRVVLARLAVDPSPLRDASVSEAYVAEIAACYSPQAAGLLGESCESALLSLYRELAARCLPAPACVGDGDGGVVLDPFVIGSIEGCLACFGGCTGTAGAAALTAFEAAVGIVDPTTTAMRFDHTTLCEALDGGAP